MNWRTISRLPLCSTPPTISHERSVHRWRRSFREGSRGRRIRGDDEAGRGPLITSTLQGRGCKSVPKTDVLDTPFAVLTATAHYEVTQRVFGTPAISSN